MSWMWDCDEMFFFACNELSTLFRVFLHLVHDTVVRSLIFVCSVPTDEAIEAAERLRGDLSIDWNSIQISNPNNMSAFKTASDTN